MSFHRTFWSAVLVPGLVLGGALGFSLLIRDQIDSRNVQRAIAAAPTSYTLYLPLVRNRYPLETVFGVEMNQITTSGGLDQVVAADTTWVRRNAVLWSDVESQEGTYDWSAVADLETELRQAATRGIQVILIVRNAPLWAQKFPGYYCGAIKREKLEAFGKFMAALTTRYSVPPYGVKYWEIWNEPDVDPAFFASANSERMVARSLRFSGTTTPYGCWGDAGDYYYGGGYYADMLQVVYPQIKAANPQAQVLVGGLLLACDPVNVCPTNNAPRFFEGILRHNELNDGGNYFDGVGFHNYEDYWGKLGHYGSPDFLSNWNTTGPGTIAEARFIKNLLKKYGLSNKFVMNTETSIVCGGFSDPPGGPGCESVPSSTFELTKAYLVPQLYASSIAEGLRTAIWYSVLGWRNSGLLYDDLSPRPAYTAYQFARKEIRDAQFVREIKDYPAVQGYEFNRLDRRIWILWALDDNPHSIQLPGMALKAWDALGTPIQVSTSMTINHNPLYLEWNP